MRNFRILVCLFLVYVLSVHCVLARVIGGTEMEDMPLDENLCVLTFDDGPSIFTPQLLDTLKAHDVRATFFMLGRMVDNYKDIALRVEAEGHEIASHTYAHKNLKRLNYTKQWEEIERGYHSLTDLGIIPTFMRPPYGNYDERTLQIANEFGLHVVLWSIDSKDWKRLPSDYSKLASAHGHIFAPGEMHGVFLFHDIHKRTVDDVPRVIRELKAAGCTRFVTFGEYMAALADPEPPLLLTRIPRSQNPSIPVLDLPIRESLEPQDESPVPSLLPEKDTLHDQLQTKPQENVQYNLKSIALPAETSLEPSSSKDTPSF
ncbi:MAG: polysaccharide deacetylase family protein [Desulfovibrionaceae bacterium]|nr:polysaccharide deacetylase family protein [Desulfovibrionaceae bacterium]